MKIMVWSQLLLLVLASISRMARDSTSIRSLGSESSRKLRRRIDLAAMVLEYHQWPTVQTTHVTPLVEQ